MALVTRGKRPPRLDEPSLSDRAWELIQQCWVTEPQKRLRMKVVAARMMAISQCVYSPTNARNDGMFQDASLSLSTSSTTVTPSQAVPHLYATVATGGKTFTLAAKGIALLCERLDALTFQAGLAPNTPLTLKLQVGTSDASAGHDFSPSLYFTTWAPAARCITKLLVDGQMHSSEHAPLTLTYERQVSDPQS